jgi:hypothetical protein
MVDVSRSGDGQEDDFLPQHPAEYARIDRAVGNTAISRDFVRAVLSWGIDRQGMVIDRCPEYRPLIDRVEM